MSSWSRSNCSKVTSFGVRSVPCRPQPRPNLCYVGVPHRGRLPSAQLEGRLATPRQERRFPTDAEFREGLETRDVYDMRHCLYLLNRLENDSKEKIDTSSYPYPSNTSCRRMMTCALSGSRCSGPNGRRFRRCGCIALGNITLTGYNTEYSDLPFEQKKTLVDKTGRQVGFDFSPFRLNKFIREQQSWTATEIEKRGKDLAAKAISIWPALTVDTAAVKEAELEDRKAQAARYSLDGLEFDVESRALFDRLRPADSCAGR